MPAKYKATKPERVKVVDLEKKGYVVIPDNMLRCCECGDVYSVDQLSFYESSSPIHKGNTAIKKIVHKGKENTNEPRSFVPYCKTCLFKDFSIDNMESVMGILYLMDIPYIDSIFTKTVTEGRSKTEEGTFGFYVKNIALTYKSLRFKDSEEVLASRIREVDENKELEITMNKKRKEEAVKRWGLKWTDFELINLEEFYHSMKRANKIETPQDEDYLKKLARFSIKIDKAIDDDETSKAKQLGDLYSKYMTDSKFRAMDMTDADKQGGIRTFSQIYSEVESVDFIPPWTKYAKFLKIKQDIVDYAIMHIENFTLRFNSAERMIIPPSDTPKVEECDE